MPEAWLAIPCVQKGEDLLHLLQDLAKHLGLLNAKSRWAKTEPKPQGIIKGIVLPSLIGTAKVINFIVVIIIMGQAIKEWIPDKINSMSEWPDLACGGPACEGRPKAHSCCTT